MENARLAQRIRAFRKLKGYTQTAFAETLGISVSILGAIERGTRRPDARLLKQISEALFIDETELVGNEGDGKETY